MSTEAVLLTEELVSQKATEIKLGVQLFHASAFGYEKKMIYSFALHSYLVFAGEKVVYRGLDKEQAITLYNNAKPDQMG